MTGALTAFYAVCLRAFTATSSPPEFCAGTTHCRCSMRFARLSQTPQRPNGCAPPSPPKSPTVPWSLCPRCSVAALKIRSCEFLLQGYREGGGLCSKLGDAVTAPLLHAERHLLGEACLLRGFVRFADVGGALVAVITPKNYVLPFFAQHFVLRYREEQFMIFDKTHRAALVYQNGRAEILQVDHMAFPEISEAEARYQALWKRFYHTISIESRENPRCRMSHMPKRYWENMLEVSDLVPPSSS